MNKHRWEQWLSACAFALVPLMVWLLFVQIVGVQGDTGTAEASREFLFFCMAVCTLALSDLRHADATMRGRRGYEMLNAVSILTIMQAAFLYGMFLMAQDKHQWLSKLFVFSIGAAVFGFGVSTFTQIFIHRGESNGSSA